MSFQTGQIGFCDFSHKDANQGGRICPESVNVQLFTKDLPIMNRIELSVAVCDCSHKKSGLLVGSVSGGPGSVVTA